MTEHTLGGAHPDYQRLRRLIAGRDLSALGVKAGDIGGWVERTEQVSGNAQVSENAEVSENAQVFRNARVSGDALVTGGAQVSGNALVTGNALVK